jgi:hypothetical protein
MTPTGCSARPCLSYVKYIGDVENGYKDIDFSRYCSIEWCSLLDEFAQSFMYDPADLKNLKNLKMHEISYHNICKHISEIKLDDEKGYKIMVFMSLKYSQNRYRNALLNYCYVMNRYRNNPQGEEPKYPVSELYNIFKKHRNDNHNPVYATSEPPKPVNSSVDKKCVGCGKKR